MSVIEDGRQIMQDFIAPELRELRVRFDNLERAFAEMKQENREFRQHVDAQFKKAEHQNREFRQHVDARFDKIEDYLSLRKQFERRGQEFH